MASVTTTGQIKRVEEYAGRYAIYSWTADGITQFYTLESADVDMAYAVADNFDAIRNAMVARIQNDKE